MASSNPPSPLLRRAIVQRLVDVAQRPSEAGFSTGVDDEAWPLVVVDVGRRIADDPARARFFDRLTALRQRGPFALVLDCRAAPLLDAPGRHAFAAALATDELRWPGSVSALALVATDAAQQRAHLALSWLLASSGIEVASFDNVADARAWGCLRHAKKAKAKGATP